MVTRAVKCRGKRRELTDRDRAPGHTSSASGASGVAPRVSVTDDSSWRFQVGSASGFVRERRGVVVVVKLGPPLLDWIQYANATDATVLGEILDDSPQPFGLLQASVGFAEGGEVRPKSSPLPSEVVEIRSRGAGRRAVIVSPEFYDRAVQAPEDQADIRGAAEARDEAGPVSHEELVRELDL